MTSKAAKLGINCLIFIVVLIVSLLAAELFCRAFIPEWTPRESERINFWHFDPQLGWAHKPGQQGEMLHQDFSINVSINPQGFRDDDYPLQRNHKKRMLVLGDSFAWGFGVEKDQRFSEIIEAKFPHWEVINTAVSGYSTDQEYLQLLETGQQYQPDLVILLVHRNDFGANNSPTKYGYSKPWFDLDKNLNLQLKNSPVQPADPITLFERHLYGKTWFLGRAYNTLKPLTQLLKSLTTHPANRSDFSYPELMDSPERTLVTTTKILEATHHLINQHQGKLAIFGISLTDDQSEALELFSQQKNITWLDLSPHFHGKNKTHTFTHDFHWNQQGHKLAAQLIEQQLISSKLLTVNTDQ